LFKRNERLFYLLLLVATATCGVMGFYALVSGGDASGKWFASMGLLATAAGVVQLEVSGLFEKIMEVYGDDDKYPYGPPSYITRQIIDNPDRPFSTWTRNTLFFRVSTGFWLIVLGTLIQVVTVWM